MNNLRTETKRKMINDERYSWFHEERDGVKVYLKGSFWYEGKCFCNIPACKKLLEIFNCRSADGSTSLPPIAALEKKILELRGHFSFVVVGANFVLATVDKIRSFPIFYSVRNGTILFSNSAVKLQERCGLYEKDEESFLEFKMAGYVTGRNTLFKNLFQLQAGEFLLFNKKTSRLAAVRYYRYCVDEIVDKTTEELLENLHEVTIETFTKMVETLDGKPVWIPLSGGLDSRLVLAMLHELKYENVFAFSYGVPGLWEIEQAKKVAEHLKIRWRHIPFNPKKIKKLFHTAERRNYFNFASGLSSVPFLPDFYALWILRDHKILPDSAVIINGQSGDYLTGGHIPKITKEIKEDEINTRVLSELIINKHFSLWVNLITEENISVLSGKILSLLQLTPASRLSDVQFARHFELYEWQERQSKYVVNGQRIYDWFGYDWRLPLWSDELICFWSKVPWGKKCDQKLYKEYLRHHDFAGVFNNIEKCTQISRLPITIKLLDKILALACRITSKDPEIYCRKYLQYHATHAPFYPQMSYFKYLKDSQWHRNYVSYLANNFLENIGL